ncbi:hypothetical protein [Micromonospora sicca]|uniref:hypothetical protein n=1 Tax=Micromonospora sicca TaxID=2202420 RepID=UPI0011B52DD5|nr:hypothetical protein [Micromonospora sp. 4G51]
MINLGYAALGTALPVQDHLIDSVVATALGMPLADTNIRERVWRPLQELLAASYEQVRACIRNPSWATPPERSMPPLAIRDAILSWPVDACPSNLSAALIELCAEVEAEDALTGLASSIASIDPSVSNTVDQSPSAQLLSAIWIETVNTDAS